MTKQPKDIANFTTPKKCAAFLRKIAKAFDGPRDKDVVCRVHVKVRMARKSGGADVKER